VFCVPDAAAARRCRDSLLAVGLGTKILPEAVTWHFAGTWTHMPELVARHGDLASAFGASRARLERAVSLPFTVRMEDSVPGRMASAIGSALA